MLCAFAQAFANDENMRSVAAGGTAASTASISLFFALLCQAVTYSLTHPLADPKLQFAPVAECATAEVPSKPRPLTFGHDPLMPTETVSPDTPQIQTFSASMVAIWLAAMPVAETTVNVVEVEVIEPESSV